MLILLVLTVRSGLKAAQADADQNSHPELVIRRCRRMIAAIRTDLAGIPATREVHEVYAEAASAEAACAEAEKELTV